MHFRGGRPHLVYNRFAPVLQVEPGEGDSLRAFGRVWCSRADCRILRAEDDKQDESGDSTSAEDKPARIVGLAAVYDTPYRIGSEEWGYEESIAPGAFEYYRDDVVCTFNHNFDCVLGRQANDTLTLNDRSEGLELDVTLDMEDDDAERVYRKVERRTVTGMSVMFSYWGEYGDYEYTEKSDGWDTLRIIRATLFEAGPVVMPAYNETTAEVRKVVEMMRAERREMIERRSKIEDWLQSAEASA